MLIMGLFIFFLAYIHSNASDTPQYGQSLGLREALILKNYPSSFHGWFIRDGCLMLSDVIWASV